MLNPALPTYTSPITLLVADAVRKGVSTHLENLSDHKVELEIRLGKLILKREDQPLSFALSPSLEPSFATPVVLRQPNQYYFSSKTLNYAEYFDQHPHLFRPLYKAGRSTRQILQVNYANTALSSTETLRCQYRITHPASRGNPYAKGELEHVIEKQKVSVTDVFCPISHKDFRVALSNEKSFDPSVITAATPRGIEPSPWVCVNARLMRRNEYFVEPYFTLVTSGSKVKNFAQSPQGVEKGNRQARGHSEKTDLVRTSFTQPSDKPWFEANVFLNAEKSQSIEFEFDMARIVRDFKCYSRGHMAHQSHRDTHIQHDKNLPFFRTIAEQALSLIDVIAKM
ncbi:mRNA capping enzyme, beta chain, putative [Angomonas deanei]|uniref:mRNA 5'-phosphatase n=1 Tax=Angomonas deanei TaxID=59799 RepID=A0A7G2CKB3_9TRYP|nr:mRNA capping enzyme, beta chain, putative [Angomonas deanei]